MDNVNPIEDITSRIQTLDVSNIEFTPKTWVDDETTGTPITAQDMNRLEQAIQDLSTSVNTLQDSVSQTISDNVLCTRIGSVAVVSVDYIASSKAWSSTQIGTLPEGMRATPGLGTDGGVHIAPLGYRGNADGRTGYLAVYSQTGNIFIWTSTAGTDQRYYFGQVVVPLLH